MSISIQRLIAGEPLPLIPEGVSPEVDRYLRALHEFLRRLGSILSDENLVSITTELTELGSMWEFAIEKWVDVTGTGTFELDNRDWRGRLIQVTGLAVAGTPAGAKDAHWAYASNFVIGMVGDQKDDSFYSFWGNALSGNNCLVEVLNTESGKLQLRVAAFAARVQLRVVAMASFVKTGIDGTI